MDAPMGLPPNSTPRVVTRTTTTTTRVRVHLVGQSALDWRVIKVYPPPASPTHPPDPPKSNARVCRQPTRHYTTETTAPPPPPPEPSAGDGDQKCESSAPQAQRERKFTFASSDLKRREPPGKTARSSAEDRGSISARLAPAVATGTPNRRLNRGRRGRDPESTSRASPATRGGAPSVFFAESVAFGGFITPHQHKFCKTDTSIEYPLNIRRLC